MIKERLIDLYLLVGFILLIVDILTLAGVLEHTVFDNLHLVSWVFIFMYPIVLVTSIYYGEESYGKDENTV